MKQIVANTYVIEWATYMDGAYRIRTTNLSSGKVVDIQLRGAMAEIGLSLKPGDKIQSLLRFFSNSNA